MNQESILSLPTLSVLSYVPLHPSAWGNSRSLLLAPFYRHTTEAQCSDVAIAEWFVGGFFQGRPQVSRTPNPKNPYATEDALELLILLRLPPKFWDYSAHCHRPLTAEFYREICSYAILRDPVAKARWGAEIRTECLTDQHMGLWSTYNESLAQEKGRHQGTVSEGPRSSELFVAPRTSISRSSGFSKSSPCSLHPNSIPLL